MMQGKWPGAPGLSRRTGAACTRWQSSEQPLLQVSDRLTILASDRDRQILWSIDGTYKIERCEME
jgi:hypothetical protein